MSTLGFSLWNLVKKSFIFLLLNIHLFYMIHLGNKFSLALATTLKMDEDQNKGDPQKARIVSLDDSFEYVMFGRVYRIQEDDGTTCETPSRL